MKITFISMLLICFSSLSAQVKSIPIQTLDSFLSKERVFYLQADGKTYYGCSDYLEGLPINILFTSATINQTTKEVYLSGYVYDAIVIKDNGYDTIGMGADFFIAKPDKERLLNTQPLDVFISPDTGHFKLSFIYAKGTNLYFSLPAPYCMRELRLDKLFEQKRKF